MKKIFWTVFALLTVAVGLYPLIYFVFDMSGGFLSLKSRELLQSELWKLAFYLHISFGGLALLAGFTQFSKRLRMWKAKLHRTLGKIYLISVVVGGIAGLYMSMYATGGISSVLGFGSLAIAWLYTSYRAYNSIRSRDVVNHQYWMIRSYALCWGAVTLRLWAPLLQFGVGLEFIVAYRIVAWINWLNLIVAEIIIRNLKKKSLKPTNKTADLEMENATVN
jgi:hypothetical protein